MIIYLAGVSLNAMKKITKLSGSKIYYILRKRSVSIRDFKMAKGLRRAGLIINLLEIKNEFELLN
jgi:hypothetical protein